MIQETELLIIGAGPAGLSAAAVAAEHGATVTVLERNPNIGGQLIKQTHMFFGSKEQHASVRGIGIPAILLERINKTNGKVTIYPETTAVGIYEDGVVTAMYKEEKYLKFKPKAILVATGASEKSLPFPNNDLPGIYGAGAVQTLMNVYGVKPGNKVLMLGCGNIGLIVSYQLMQAGVQVLGILDAAPKIGGYLVHAAKVRRMGVPILVSHTVVRADGDGKLEKVTIAEVDDHFQPIPGTEKEIETDVLCIAVGLSPLGELLHMAGCQMVYIPQLSGFVPVRNSEYETTREGIFVAGDACGIEEASAAMVEGSLAGLCAAKKIGYADDNFEADKKNFEQQLKNLRGGPAGERINQGIRLMMQKGGVQ